jgi:metal-dependent amidase/aminoacylase/carboxypeptidase family protein
MTTKLTTTLLAFLALLHMASAQYTGWQRSGSIWILTTPEGANLPATASEDFAYFANEVPCLFLGLGGLAKGQDPKTAPAHHTPDFYIDESGMKLGVRVLSNLVVDYTTKVGK